MRVYTLARLKYNGVQYTLDEQNSIWYDYNGPIELCCGAPKGEKDLAKSQSAFFKTLQGQLSTVFGGASKVFNDLVGGFEHIFLGGPNQKGFSPAEESALKSHAITTVGQQYRNAKQAVGEQIASYGGGNNYMPAGAQIGPQVQLASAAANETSGELNNIDLQNYAVGRQNWLAAASGLSGATNVFNPATGLANAATGASSAAGQTWNDVAQADNSWVNGLIGAGAGIAGSVLGGLASRGKK